MQPPRSQNKNHIGWSHPGDSAYSDMDRFSYNTHSLQGNRPDTRPLSLYTPGNRGLILSRFPHISDTGSRYRSYYQPRGSLPGNKPLTGLIGFEYLRPACKPFCYYRRLQATSPQSQDLILLLKKQTVPTTFIFKDYLIVLHSMKIPVEMIPFRKVFCLVC